MEKTNSVVEEAGQTAIRSERCGNQDILGRLEFQIVQLIGTQCWKRECVSPATRSSSPILHDGKKVTKLMAISH